MQTRYFTHDVHATYEDTNGIEARISQSFNVPILRKPEDWVVAVERFEVNTNSIPFYTGGEIIRFTAKILGVEQSVITPDAFSLVDLVRKINDIFQNSGQTQPPNASISIDTEGFIQMTYGAFAAWDIILPPRLAGVFDFVHTSTNDLGGLIDLGFGTVLSRTPRWDCGDELQLIQITSNLPVVSDNIGQVKTNVLTDLSYPKSLGASMNADGTEGGNSFSQRQRLIYNPSERRYVNLIGAAPISTVTVKAFYVNPRGVSFPIFLYPGMTFSIKLGFYARI